MNTPDPVVQAAWDIFHPGMPMPPKPTDVEDEVVPLPTDMGLYVIKDGSSVGRWAATVYAIGPNGQWYQTLPLVKTDEDSIRARLFDGQELERLIPASEADQ